MTIIKYKDVERVDTYRYIGIALDNKLTWRQNTEAVVKKTKPRIYCLRKLGLFNVNKNLLQLFHSSVYGKQHNDFWSGILGRQPLIVVAKLKYNGCAVRKDRQGINKLMKTKGGVVGKNQEDIMTPWERRIIKKCLKDKTQNSAL